MRHWSAKQAGKLPPNAPMQVCQLVDACRPLLADKHPAVQGAALAELLATYIAGITPPLRAEILEAHLATVNELIPLISAEIWSDHAD